MARFAEGVQVISGLLHSAEPFSFDGSFFHLRDAELSGPRRPGGPPIMIGGAGPRRTLPLVARYADIWNAQVVTPAELRERSALLDDLLAQAGRQPEAVRRTMNIWVICGRTLEELADRVRPFRVFPDYAELPLDALLAELRTWPAIIGSPDEVVEQIRTYGATGITELSVQWPGLDDIEGLQVLAREVMPRLHATSP
jgi:alkanesulfonate monooxygenase SsuD/methylene tetrahydromethanopterin reductase-like flavin-dependent oxidoreductase (luciferase family)